MLDIKNQNKTLFWKIVESLAFYAALPGGVILTLGNPTHSYKMAICLCYLMASVCSMIYAKRTNQTAMFVSAICWGCLELYGLFFPPIINF